VLSVYVYYQVPADNAATARTAARRILDEVAAVAGVRGRLLCRRDRDDTWMEVYEGIADTSAFERALQEAVAASGFTVAAAGAVRHTERFVPLEGEGAAPRAR